MNRVTTCFRTKIGWVSLAVAFIPLISLIASFLLLGGSPQEPKGASASESSDLNMWVVLGLSVVFLILAIKIAAVIGNVMGWYYGWLLHILELNFVLFFVGITIILSIFTTELSVEGAIRVVIGLCCLAINLKLKALWTGRELREHFDVTRMTHSEYSGACFLDK